MSETTSEPSETGCCPRFDPGPWQEREIDLADRLFLKDRVRSVLHVPIDFGRVMRRCQERIEAAGAALPAPLVVTDENSLWGADLYLEVAREVDGAQNARVPGTFVTRAFEGPYHRVHAWCREMQSWVAGRGQSVRRLLFYYTTCPRCAKAYGENWVVLLAEV